MAGKNNWKENKYIPMVKLRCPGNGEQWGNPTKPNEYRCCKCGKVDHVRS